MRYQSSRDIIGHLFSIRAGQGRGYHLVPHGQRRGWVPRLKPIVTDFWVQNKTHANTKVGRMSAETVCPQTSIEAFRVLLVTVSKRPLY